MEDKDTSMEKSASLMKCPPAVSRAFKSVAASSSASDNPIVGKIIETIDLLNPDESAAREYFYEPAQSDTAHAPTRYKLNISTDCAPLAVFSETHEGKLSLEGKVEGKLSLELEGTVDSVLKLEPHFDNFEDYSKSFRGRTKTVTVETRGIKAIEIEHLRNLKDEKLGGTAVEPSTTNANAAANQHRQM